MTMKKLHADDIDLLSESRLPDPVVSELRDFSLMREEQSLNFSVAAYEIKLIFRDSYREPGKGLIPYDHNLADSLSGGIEYCLRRGTARDQECLKEESRLESVTIHMNYVRDVVLRRNLGELSDSFKSYVKRQRGGSWYSHTKPRHKRADPPLP